MTYRNNLGFASSSLQFKHISMILVFLDQDIDTELTGKIYESNGEFII